MHTRRFFLVALISLFVSGCAHVRTDSMGGPSANLGSFKRAYIQAPVEDEFRIHAALAWELNDIGLEVMGAPFEAPTDDDLVVSFSYVGGWDLTRYLKSFQIQFTNARTKRVVATSSYSSTGIWRGARDGRLEDAFNSIRAENGLPPTKQFSR